MNRATSTDNLNSYSNGLPKDICSRHRSFAFVGSSPVPIRKCEFLLGWSVVAPPTPGSGCAGKGHHSTPCPPVQVPLVLLSGQLLLAKPAYPPPQPCHLCHWLLIPHSASYGEPDHSRRRAAFSHWPWDARTRGAPCNCHLPQM